MTNDGFKALLNGALDLGGIATNASYDLLKFIGANALKRLRDPKIRGRILSDARKRMVAGGMPDGQATFLKNLAAEKELLQRGAMQDVTRLSELIQTEVTGAGCLPFEGEALYQALVQSIAGALASDSFTGSLMAGSYLSAHPTPVARGLLYQFAQALHEPEKLGGELLARILREAGQMQAKLAVSADGKIEIAGEYSLHIQADGPDAGMLQDAMERVKQGETVTVDASKPGSIRFTLGHAILDRLQGFDRPIQALRFSPAPQVFKQVLYARVPRLGEVAINAELTLLPNQQGLRLTLVDRPEFKFSLTFTPEVWTWDFHVDWAERPPEYGDRKVMKFLTYLAHPNGRVVDEKGKQLFKLGDSWADLQRLGWVAEVNLHLIELRQYVQAELGGQLRLPLPDLDEKEFRTLRDMTRCAQHELDGTSQYLRGQYLVTEDFVRSLTGQNARNEIYLEMTQYLSLPDSTPLKLTKNFARPKITMRQNGRKVGRSKWPSLIGQTVEVEFFGEISRSSLVENQDI